MARISPVSNPFRHTILCRLDTDAKDECSNSLDLHTTMGMRMKMKTSIALLFRLQYHCTVVRSKWFKINGFVLLIMAFVGETFCGRLVLRLVGTMGSWFPCWAPGEITPKIFNNHYCHNNSICGNYWYNKESESESEPCGFALQSTKPYQNKNKHPHPPQPHTHT